MPYGDMTYKCAIVQESLSNSPSHDSKTDTQTAHHDHKRKVEHHTEAQPEVQSEEAKLSPAKAADPDTHTTSQPSSPRSMKVVKHHDTDDKDLSSTPSSSSPLSPSHRTLKPSSSSSKETTPTTTPNKTAPSKLELKGSPTQSMQVSVCICVCVESWSCSVILTPCHTTPNANNTSISPTLTYTLMYTLICRVLLRWWQDHPQPCLHGTTTRHHRSQRWGVEVGSPRSGQIWRGCRLIRMRCTTSLNLPLWRSYLYVCTVLLCH